MTYGAFYTFWRFSTWIRAKLVPIYSKRQLMTACMPFFPLPLHFTTFLFRVYRNQNFEILFFNNKVTSVFKLFSFLNFFMPFPSLLFLSFCSSDWPSTGLASSLKISQKASLRQSIFTARKGIRGFKSAVNYMYICM